jgi:hypothetical protein
MWETEIVRKCLTCQTLIFLSSQLLIFYLLALIPSDLLIFLTFSPSNLLNFFPNSPHTF